MNAINRFTVPAIKPFNAAICTGSPAETRRVRLLSMPQAKHAPAIPSGPQAALNSGFPDHDSGNPPSVMAAMPSAMRRSKFSLKTNHASKAVKTPSRLRSNDAEDAVVIRKPKSSKIEPSTPPERIAPASHGKSARFRPLLECSVLSLSVVAATTESDLCRSQGRAKQQELSDRCYQAGPWRKACLLQTVVRPSERNRFRCGLTVDYGVWSSQEFFPVSVTRLERRYTSDSNNEAEDSGVSSSVEKRTSQ